MSEISLIESISLLYQNAIAVIFKGVHEVQAEFIGSFIKPVVIIYILIAAYYALVGKISKAWPNLIRMFVYLPVMLYLTGTLAVYLKLVAIPLELARDFFVNGIISITAATDNENATRTLDMVTNNIYSFVINDVMDGSILTSPVDYFTGVIILIIYFYLYIIIGYMMIKSLVAVSFYLMIGIIPLWLFAFDGTKQITSNWAKTTITYALYAPITAFFMVFVYYVTAGTSSNLTDDYETLGLLIVSGGILTLLVKDIPEYANGITQGMSSGGDASGAAGVGFKWGKIGAGKAGLNKLNKVTNT
ncbi:MAG: hypothetical protein DRG78_00745 [Epsilonproteobacteria bacterium]|nr:MAG: hypothetical protein DRG78_00745 [Campylobacterota bacterium]